MPFFPINRGPSAGPRIGQPAPIADPRISGPFNYNPQPQAPQMGGDRVLGTFKKGGKVKKTGIYKLHKGEKVVALADMAGRK